MFDAGDLSFLSRWCDRRGLGWTPGPAGQPFVLLQRGALTRPWQRKVVQGSAGTFQLLDEAGVLLVEASSLPSLLDAVDAGDGEPQPRSAINGIVALAAYAGMLADLVL